jgi:hypothetical protein
MPEGFLCHSVSPLFEGLCSDDRCEREGDAGDSGNDEAADDVDISTTSADGVSHFDLITHLIIDPGNERNAQLH